MQSIVLIMRRKPVATALRQRIQDVQDLDLVISCVYEYDQTPGLVRQDEGTAALIELRNMACSICPIV